MATKKTDNNRPFTIYARGSFESCVEILATNLDEALEKAKELKLDSFIEFQGDHCDSDFHISGVFDSK